MAHDYSRTDLDAFAARHGLTEEQARRVRAEHGDDESTWGETARNLIHFFKAPS